MLTIITAQRRIDRQRQKGVFLSVPKERREYAKRCMAVILAGTADQDRQDQAARKAIRGLAQREAQTCN